MANKTETKKKSSDKKPVKKKQTKKVTKVTEEQPKKMVEELVDETIVEKTDLKNIKNENVEYDLTKTTEEKPLEAVNGDPAVLDVVDEKEDNLAKKITKRINQYFGYFWNGQSIEY